MSSYVIRILSPQVALACAAILSLTACERSVEKAEPAGEFAWARAALERNPQLEVVASDPQSGVLTIRNLSTGQVQAVRLSELAAAPVSQIKALAVPATATPPTSTSVAAVVAETDAAPAPAVESSTAEPPRPPDQVAATRADDPGWSESKNYTMERTNGKLRVTGPGISIVSSGPATTAGTLNPAGQRTVEPIICEGRRMLHFDNRSIYVDGNAITVRGGCELFITNSRIIASGTGIIVRDAIVHVSNSHIEGADGSFDADDRAKMYVRDTTFQGVPKRTELALVQDQGGNRWR